MVDRWHKSLNLLQTCLFILNYLTNDYVQSELPNSVYLSILIMGEVKVNVSNQWGGKIK